MAIASSIDQLRIRPLRSEEIGVLAGALRDSTTVGQVENRWREQELGYREVLVAAVAGELVGTVSISVTAASPASLHLFALDVGEVWRGQGIGTAIVDYVVAEARRRRCGRVYLEVRVDNPARRLYHRLGFRRVGATFLNTWWRYLDGGALERVDEVSYRMVKRV